MRPLVRLALVAAALALPATAHAQFGDLLKKKAREAIEKKGGSNPAPTSTPGQGRAGKKDAASDEDRIYWADVVVLDADAVARLEQALATETKVRDSLAAVVKDAPRWQKEHQDCMMRLVQTAEYEKLADRLDAAKDSEKGAIVQDMGNLTIQRCGDGNQAERAQRAIDTLPERRAVAAGGFNSRQYAIAKERVVPFCKVMPAAPADGYAQVPGSGTNIFWVYKAAEVQALTPKCPSLGKLLDRAT